MRSFLIAAAITQLLIGSAVAQDRPLFQQFRISHPLTGSLGDHLKSSDTLDRELRRIGLIASWHSFNDGLSALRALHAGDIDVALDIAQHEAILARLENLSMVFGAEQKPRDDREAEQTFPDDTVRRYTLTSEYFADQREDALSVIFRALHNAPRSEAAIQSGGYRKGNALARAQPGKVRRQLRYATAAGCKPATGRGLVGRKSYPVKSRFCRRQLLDAARRSSRTSGGVGERCAMTSQTPASAAEIARAVRA